ncbi:MAG: dihydroorotate dehydrogenase-like protein, partial [Gemmatimonadetes bacterium]|nr:dihydroorotate dehydrogenase-like protein [Gemmatimonadota bacterium]
IDHAHAVLWQMEQWLEAHQISSITELRGRLSQIRCDDPSAFERANYIKALETYS